MKNRTLFWVLACFIFSNYANAQNSGSRVPYTVYNDFETGELFGWEAYPYAQDIAFDALYFASKTPTYKNSKYALARPLKAHDTNELYQGFTKRLNLYTVPDTRVKAAIYFQSDRNAESLDLSLGTFDGRRFLHKISKPQANTWIEIDLPLSSFSLKGQPLHADEHIQVITVEGTYPVKNYLYTYTILMDDFQINGERDTRFVPLVPEATVFEMFNVSVLNKHYFYGDMISLKTSTEGNLNLKQVNASLIDSRGKVVKDNIPFTLSENNWQNESIYKFSEKDARGQWEIRVKGIDNQGAQISQSFRFLMPGNKVNAHPRLYFNKEELKNRLANEKSPVAKRILDHVLEETAFMKVNVDAIREGIDRTAENLVGGPYSMNSVGFSNYALWNNPNSTLGTVIEEGSFRYAFTGDKAAGEQAKKALLKLCSFKKWNADWMLERKFWTYYPVGYTIKPVAYGYDMLYDLLSDSERSFVRNAIMEKGLKMFHRDMVEMNRMPSNQTNHIAVIVGGMGMAATAIYGDDPDNPTLEPYLSGILTKSREFIDRTYYEDGSYAEPKSGYMDMATRDIVEILATFERNFGVDYSTTTNVRNFYKYPIQAMHSSGLIQSYGDGGRSYSGFDQIHSWWFVNRTKNPYLYNFVKPFWESGKGGYLGYLWFRDDITPLKRETLTPSKIFSAQGMVMRNGWDDASTIITTRVGPNNNHAHYDQGSFQIMTNGEELLTDPGIGALGYYANLEFLSYDVQAIAHNVMLIDHDPESQAPAHYDNGIAALKTWPTMTHSFAGKIADAVESDLSSVYKDKLEKYSRTLLYTKTGPVFLFDQVKSKTGGHIYNWLFHAPQNEGNKRSIAYKDNRVTIDRPNARLTMDIISSGISERSNDNLALFSYAADLGSASIRDRADKKFAESFLTLVSKPDLNEANFFAVLLPEAKPVSGNYSQRPVTTKIEADGWIGARIDHGEESSYGFFRNGASANGIANGFTTDSKHFTASIDRSGALTKVYFEGASFIGHGLSVSSTNSITAAIAISTKEISLELQSEDAGKLSLSIIKKPLSVLSNGQVLRDWSYNDQTKMLSLKVPKGRTEMNVKLK
ncbi:Heparinase II/III-like protein [Daejeonella rubra]|uniref:Heparinase II/III-like protein n=1 Tax=Daejeonella rubra TaxID=990371 RepID=A0A1G9SKR3_9SPHI|nr:DUF4962 domain-containing protein [Daejeonella rubra]SDM36068.1 Heparinase II/III-like protein [Daejeonella rubra]